jgi:hypothetical protein
MTKTQINSELETVRQNMENLDCDNYGMPVDKEYFLQLRTKEEELEAALNNL